MALEVVPSHLPRKVLEEHSTEGKKKKKNMYMHTQSKETIYSNNSWVAGDLSLAKGIQQRGLLPSFPRTNAIPEQTVWEKGTHDTREATGTQIS